PLPEPVVAGPGGDGRRGPFDIDLDDRPGVGAEAAGPRRRERDGTVVDERTDEVDEPIYLVKASPTDLRLTEVPSERLPRARNLVDQAWSMHAPLPQLAGDACLTDLVELVECHQD